MLEACSADFDRAVLGASFACLGEAFALSVLEARADERGVTFVFVRTSWPGVLVCLPLGVAGSDLIVGVGREPVDFVGGVAIPFPATRGVIGVRAVRFDASDGLIGRLVLVVRSEAIEPIVLSLLSHWVSPASRVLLPKLEDQF